VAAGFEYAAPAAIWDEMATPPFQGITYERLED
jgi:predicted molibdopterin-dependent oxidoreductase YjgC